MSDLPIPTLPGSIPGLLRRGSPVIVGECDATVIDSCGGWEPYIIGCYRRGDFVIDEHARACDLALDLSDATGRAHAAWWAGGGQPLATGGYFVNLSAVLGEDGSIVRLVFALLVRLTDGGWRRYQAEPMASFSGAVIVPALAALDPDDPRLLPDGSRWVDAEALRLICLHVAGGGQ